jgi:hypothetical protein
MTNIENIREEETMRKRARLLKGSSGAVISSTSRCLPRARTHLDAAYPLLGSSPLLAQTTSGK